MKSWVKFLYSQSQKKDLTINFVLNFEFALNFHF